MPHDDGFVEVLQEIQLLARFATSDTVAQSAKAVPGADILIRKLTDVAQLASEIDRGRVVTGC